MNRLRAYRELEGLTQVQLGEMLGVSGAMISQIESGAKSADPIDPRVLGYSRRRLALPDMGESMHRRKSTTRISSLKRAREFIRLAGEIYTELAAITPKAPPVLLERLAAPTSDYEIEQAARSVRVEILSCSDEGPINNLTAAVERAGICLIPLPDLAGMDGISAWVEGQPVIGLAPNAPGDRFRLTLSHELGHLVMHRKATPTIEDEANRFAACLLMSDDEFEDALPDHPKLIDFLQIKGNWGISVAALVYRAHAAGLIDDRRYRSLQIQMSSEWAHAHEPASFDPVHGRAFQRLVEAHGGAREVARRLEVNPQHLAALCTWNHLRLV